jgi:hypothetical protein
MESPPNAKLAFWLAYRWARIALQCQWSAIVLYRMVHVSTSYDYLFSPKRWYSPLNVNLASWIASKSAVNVNGYYNLEIPGSLFTSTLYEPSSGRPSLSCGLVMYPSSFFVESKATMWNAKWLQRREFSQGYAFGDHDFTVQHFWVIYPQTAKIWPERKIPDKPKTFNLCSVVGSMRKNINRQLIKMGSSKSSSDVITCMEYS